MVSSPVSFGSARVSVVVSSSSSSTSSMTTIASPQTQRRLEACGRELARTGALEAELGKCGAALHGLRKTLLPRSWDPRCSVCGVRHKDIEIHTCKFWQEWASAASVTGE